MRVRCGAARTACTVQLLGVRGRNVLVRCVGCRRAVAQGGQGSAVGRARTAPARSPLAGEACDHEMAAPVWALAVKSGTSDALVRGECERCGALAAIAL